MKVLYILHQTYARGGANLSFLALVRALRDLGVEIHIATPDANGLYEQLVEEHFHTVVTPYRYGTYPDAKNMTDWLFVFPRLVARRVLKRKAAHFLASYIEEHRIDLIHSNSSVLDLGFLVSKLARVPHVNHVREYGDTDFGYCYFPSWSLFHRQYRQAKNYTICITKDIQRHHGLSTLSTSRVIYNGVFHQQVAFGYQPKQTYLLYVGRVQETKGIFSLIKAYGASLVSDCETPDPAALPLKVAGKIVDGPFYRKLSDYIEAHHLTGRIEFLGERTDIRDLMREAKAVVIPSYSEGFGRCMAEAMFNGSVVVGRNTAGTKEQFDNGLALTGQEIGLRFEDTDQLAGILRQVMSEEGTAYREMVKRAHTVVNRLYSIESSSLQVLGFYNEIIQKQIKA